MRLEHVRSCFEFGKRVVLSMPMLARFFFWFGSCLIRTFFEIGLYFGSKRIGNVRNSDGSYFGRQRKAQYIGLQSRQIKNFHRFVEFMHTTALVGLRSARQQIRG